MQLYNTLGRRKEKFAALHPGKVGLYACGVTVYDDCHLGHARSSVFFEVLVRYLRRRGYEVTWVRNYTDIDDKILKRAKEEGVAWDEIAARYIASFQEDMAALGIPPAKIEPKATDHVPEMLTIIGRLVDRGFAYQGAANGDVYYRVRRFPGYGKLSGQSLEDLESGARIEVDAVKEDPLDFVLWKASKPGEPAWPSPWGPGRPGWHIECSAMSMKYLGETLDIHGGGRDLVFPHHENELAQSEAANEAPFARFWVHHGLLTINQEKMSKSLKNFFTVKEVLAKFPAEVVRFFLISSHYRSPLDFSDAALAEAETALLRLYAPLAAIQDILRAHPAPGNPPPRDFTAAGLAPEELERLFTLSPALRRGPGRRRQHRPGPGVYVRRGAPHQPPAGDPTDDPAYLALLAHIQQELISLGQVLNLLQADPAETMATLRQKPAELAVAPRRSRPSSPGAPRPGRTRTGPAPTRSGMSCWPWGFCWRTSRAGRCGG